MKAGAAPPCHGLVAAILLPAIGTIVRDCQAAVLSPSARGLQALVGEAIRRTLALREWLNEKWLLQCRPTTR
jgi:hypothetical protein